MSTFKITLRATGTRMISDQTGAEETIQSEFIGHGTDALDASKDATTDFRARYSTIGSLDKNMVGCADLDDFEITAIIVEPYNEED